MTFVSNQHFEDEWKRSDDGAAFLRDVAGSIADAARGLAPVKTGDYQSSITVTDAEDGNGVWVVATDWKAGFIEFGTTNNPAWAPLLRGAESVGLTVEARRGGA